MTVAFDSLKVPFTGNPDDLKPVAITTGIRNTVAALGTVTADAALIPTTYKVTTVTGADAAKGVRLTANAALGTHTQIIINSVNAVLKVYPPTGGTINGAAANAAYSLPALTSKIFHYNSASDVWTI